MRIVQIAPHIGPGSGVAGVAYNLERAWALNGIETLRFTLREARGDWLPREGPGLRGRLGHLVRVVWFSTVGTWLARRYLRRHPDLWSICHNDALAGDVYVNHGILAAAMRARGHYAYRMMRNPLHVFTALRDRSRYGAHGPHRLVVCLTRDDDQLLRQTYPRLSTPTTVIGNGVDLDAYRPPTAEERESARRSLGLAADDVAVLFVGHEFARKGLPVVFDALAGLPSHHKLVVVGGTGAMIDDARRQAERADLQERIHFAGRVADPRRFYHASDVFVLPSAYEAGPLVVLEALACGLPVVAAPNGLVSEVVSDGVNGFVVPVEARAVGTALLAISELDQPAVRGAARASVLPRSWSTIADEYVTAISAARRHAHGREADR